MDRLTYKSMFGDYGLNFNATDMEYYQIIEKLANRLGAYEDLNMTPEQIKELLNGANKQ